MDPCIKLLHFEFPPKGKYYHLRTLLTFWFGGFPCFLGSPDFRRSGFMRLCARAVLEFVPPRTYTYAELTIPGLPSPACCTNLVVTKIDFS